MQSVNKSAETYRNRYIKFRNSKDKSSERWARQNQIRYEKRIFTAESAIDRINDKLGYSRGDYNIK